METTIFQTLKTFINILPSDPRDRVKTQEESILIRNIKYDPTYSMLIENYKLLHVIKFPV